VSDFFGGLSKGRWVNLSIAVCREGRLSALRADRRLTNEGRTTKNEDPTNSFEPILEFCYGSNFRVCESKSFCQSICIELWNRELYEQLFDKFHSDLTSFNGVDRLKFLNSMNESCEREIESCSSPFSEIDSTSIFSIPFELISSILSNKSFQMKDEESLFELISSKQNEDSRLFPLFEHVRFGYLSANSMKSCIEIINESFDFLTFPIGRSLCHRLSLSVSIDFPNDRFHEKSSSIVFRFDPNSPQNGISSYLLN
jgi:hypothetical protein